MNACEDVAIGSSAANLARHYGPGILHRAQPHGTFKLLFNALYASAQPTR